MATPTKKRYMDNCMTISFTAHPAFCAAIDRLAEVDSRSSRASLIEAALRQVAKAHGVILPRRLVPPARLKP